MEGILQWLVYLVYGVWLSGITYLLLRALANYNRLTKGADSKTLSQILNDLLNHEQLTQGQLKQIGQDITGLKKDSRYFTQKLGLVRFNPFADTGGDQSFCLAFLDAQDSGIVITSLYRRSGVRWYIKTVKHGKGVEHDLSKEEEQAIKKATK